MTLYFPFDAYNYNTVIIYVGVEPPTNVRAIVLTPRSVEVTWDPSPSPIITSYLISYTTTASYILVVEV